MTSDNKSKKDKVWDKANPIRGKDSGVLRADTYGNKIRYGSYGTTGEYGWEIDHIKPISEGGSNKQQNLQPLHWQENREKADKINHKKNK